MLGQISLSYFLYLPEASVSGSGDKPGPAASCSHCLPTTLCGALPGTLVTCPWRRLGMTNYLALRLRFQICVTCRSCWFPDLVALPYCAGAGCLDPEDWRHTYEMDMEYFASPSLSVVVTKCWFLGFVARSRTYMRSAITATPT